MCNSTKFHANHAPTPLLPFLRDNHVDKALAWAPKSRQVHVSSAASSTSSSLLDSDKESCDSKHCKKVGRSTGRKPTDKPKRPLSAYNIFFQHERERILHGDSDDTHESAAAAETILLHKILSRSKGQGGRKPAKKREHVKTHGKIGFVELAKKVATKWKLLDDASRAVYTALAAVEKAQYKKEVALWEKKRISDADQDLMEIEKKEALRVERIMQGSRGIFEEQEDDVTFTTSSTTCTTYHQTNQLPTCMATSVADSITARSSTSDSVKVSVGMSHTELMAKCRADLARKMCGSGTRSRDLNVLAETENQSFASLVMEGVVPLAVRSVEREGYCHAADSDAVKTMHTCMQSFGWHNSASMPPMSSDKLADEQIMHEQDAANVGGESKPHNASVCMPEPSVFAPRNADEGIVSDEDLHSFLSDSSIAENSTSSLPSLFSVDKDFYDFFVWMSKEQET